MFTEEYPDYQTARQREIFLKSGKGREWLTKVESQSESAQGG